LSRLVVPTRIELISRV